MNSITNRRASDALRHLPRIIVALVVLLSGSMVPSLFAQSDLGSIRGSVQDSTGAVIPSASIQLKNVDTEVTQSAVSDETGNFHFEALVRGNYEATISAPGFVSQIQKIELSVSQIQALNFRLKPGAENTTVTVTDAAPIVDVTTSSTGTVIQGD